jgi:hypothetical protein
MCFWLTGVPTNRYGLSVREQRRPWLLAAVLMLASAVAAGWSTYLYWLPCRGSMLSGSIIYRYDHVGPAFSDACLRRMDEYQGWESALYVLATALAGLAWLTLVYGLRRRPGTMAVAALPGLATLVLAGAMSIADATAEVFILLLSLTIELAAAVAFLTIPVWHPDLDLRRLVRLVVVLWGTTAFGAIHTIAEFIVMVNFTEADWDTPPGFGYLTVATLTISAILTVFMTLRAPKRGADDEPHADHDSGSRSLA